MIGLLMLMTTSTLATFFYGPKIFAYFSNSQIAEVPNIIVQITPTPQPSTISEPVATSAATIAVIKEKNSTPSAQPKIENKIKTNNPDLATAVMSYFKLSNQENINIINQTVTHAQGQVGQKWWLAVNARSGWKIVASGTSYINCNDISGFNFPSSMAPACWDNATNQLINR